jgi:hypothetical protein
MTLLETIKAAATQVQGFAFYYDLRQMQNVTADDCSFPAIWFEEYYASRMMFTRYSWQREVTLELHFLQLVPMQGVAEDRERVREWLIYNGVEPFIGIMSAMARENGWSEIEEYQCDPEPPLFDANATGVLLRFTLLAPTCMMQPEPTPPTPPESEPETTNENEQGNEVA